MWIRGYCDDWALDGRRAQCISYGGPGAPVHLVRKPASDDPASLVSPPLSTGSSVFDRVASDSAAASAPCARTPIGCLKRALHDFDEAAVRAGLPLRGAPLDLRETKGQTQRRADSARSMGHSRSGRGRYPLSGSRGHGMRFCGAGATCLAARWS